MINVVCMKWGTAFSSEHVNVLMRAVRDNMTMAHRFVCYTDDPAGIDKSVHVRDFSDFPVPREKWMPGCWPRIALFKPSAFPEGDIVINLDLDLLITGNINFLPKLVLEQGGFHILREWSHSFSRMLPVQYQPDRGGQGSVFCFKAGEQAHMYQEFMADPEQVRADYLVDQKYFGLAAKNRKYLPEKMVASFKRHCVKRYPLSLLLPAVKKPPWAKIIVFHGRPDPVDLVQGADFVWGTRGKRGKGIVQWVADYWQKYSDK